MGPAMTLAALTCRAKELVCKLWADDDGAVLSAEYVMVGGILVTGVIPGLVAARNAINTAYVNMGNTIVNAVPSPTYSGYAIGGANGGPPVAAVGGVSAPVAPQPGPLQVASVPPMSVPAP